MKIAFFSNFLNHHQLPLCLALDRLTEGHFTFVATSPISRERLKFGYADMNQAYPFVLRAYEGAAERQNAMALALDADVVIHGSAPWAYLEERLAKKKLTFLYSERIYKAGFEYWKWPVRVWRHYWKYVRHKNLYMLCASAYTAYDFSRTFAFLEKTYKWGYFPETKRYDIDSLMVRKRPNNIVWAGRFLKWKHPENVVEVARRLKEEGYDFTVTMLGNGELLEETRKQVEELGLQDRVKLPGAVAADEVRTYMEEASIYLFTSDRNEGWGAVLNESMNSGCAVVACDAIGSVPFLVKDGENGLTYPQDDFEGFYRQVKLLLEDSQFCEKCGRAAYDTITQLWNAEVAAERLIQLAECLINGHETPFTDGPCSKAEILKE